MVHNYRNPPVNEVAYGCEFQPLDRLKLPHLGLFWDRVRKDYPKVEHATPIANESGLPPVDLATGFPLPRIWLINESETRLIQIQPDRLHFNWRRRDQERIYPRFPEMVSRFMECFTTFEKFTDQAGIGVIQPIAYELTYINHIPKGEGWETIEEVPKRVFRDFLWSGGEDRFLPPPCKIAWQLGFPLPNRFGRLVVKLSEAVRKHDSERLLVLELTARGLGADKTPENMYKWFDVAHEWIVEGFADFTTTDIQQNLWGRE